MPAAVTTVNTPGCLLIARLAMLADRLFTAADFFFADAGLPHSAA